MFKIHSCSGGTPQVTHTRQRRARELDSLAALQSRRIELQSHAYCLMMFYQFISFVPSAVLSVHLPTKACPLKEHEPQNNRITMAKESRILKAMFAVVKDQENKNEQPIDAADISSKTPGLSLGEIEQEMRDLQIKKLVELDYDQNGHLVGRLTEEGLQEAEKAFNH